MRFFTLFIAILLFASCAQDIYVQYPGDDQHSQSIKLQPNKPTYGTYITIDQQLIVDHRNVRSVTIQNVPVGKHEIDYVCDNSVMQHPLDANMTIWIEKGKSETHLIEVPPNSTAYWIGQAINYVLLTDWVLIWIFVI